MSLSDLLEIKYISEKKGKGAFAKDFIEKDTTIIEANVIPISDEDYDLIEQTKLYDYIFAWDDPKYNGEISCVIALSICQFINHSYKPNLKYEYNYDNDTIEYVTIKDIDKGEELTVNYNGISDDDEPVWFDVV